MLTSASPGRGGGDGAGAAASYRVIGNDRKFRSTDSGGAALIMLSALTRARETAPIPARSDADRPAPAGSAALRLLADVDISFSRNCCWQFRGRTMELGRSAPMLMAASPGRGGGDGAGAGRAQPATGSSTTIAKFCSTDSGLKTALLYANPREERANRADLSSEPPKLLGAGGNFR